MDKDIRTSNETFDENEPFSEVDICVRIVDHLALDCMPPGLGIKERDDWYRKCLDLLHESFFISDPMVRIAYQRMILDVMKE